MPTSATRSPSTSRRSRCSAASAGPAATAMASASRRPSAGSTGPSITWSFLDFGRVRQRVKAAEARRDGAIAVYQETVLEALEETENALAGFRAANRAEDELRLGLEAAHGGVAAGAPALRRRRRRLPRRAGRRPPEARFRGPARPVGDAARDGPGRALQGSRRRSLKRAQDPPRGQRREQVLQRVAAHPGRREDRGVEVLGDLGEDVGAKGHPEPAVTTSPPPRHISSMSGIRSIGRNCTSA